MKPDDRSTPAIRERPLPRFRDMTDEKARGDVAAVLSVLQRHGWHVG